MLIWGTANDVLFTCYVLFYYIQLKHAVAAQGSAVEWQQSPTPVFIMMADIVSTKGLMQCMIYVLCNVAKLIFNLVFPESR